MVTEPARWLARCVRSFFCLACDGRKLRDNIMCPDDDGDAEKLGYKAERVGENQRNDAVGYGRPPRHTRFKRGQSGIPLGRPKRTISFASELADELSRTITEHGGEITQMRAIVRKLVAAAVAGDTKVALTLIAVCAKLFRDQEADPRLPRMTRLLRNSLPAR